MLYLIDSSIYIYRAWHLTPRTSTDLAGNPVNALHGFADFLLQLLSQTRARYLVCAFDHGYRPTVRQTIYPPYKSDRAAAPESLIGQFALCRTLVKLMGVQGLERATFEADDIIDTLAQHSRAANKRVCVVSADKDLAQCIGEQDVWWNFAQKSRLDKSGIEKRFGVRPAQIPDLLALSGDKVDTIPGVPGIGPATAARLLKKWGNLDVLFDQRNKVADMKFRGARTVAELLGNYEQQVRDARLITGMFAVEQLPQDINHYLREDIDACELREFLDTNGFTHAQQSHMMTVLTAVPDATDA